MGGVWVDMVWVVVGGFLCGWNVGVVVVFCGVVGVGIDCDCVIFGLVGVF